MAYFLVLETATDICSVAIAAASDRSPSSIVIRAQRTSPNFRDHGRIITPFIEECLAEAGISMTELDAVAISSGPGSFTSLRIGAGTAKGICFGLGIPLIAIDTLQSLALAAQRVDDAEDTCYIPMIDARSMGVFMAIYNRSLDLLQPLSREKLASDFEEAPILKGHPIVCCGPAAEKYRSQLPAERINYRESLTHAAHLLPLVAKAWEQRSFADLAYYEPNYVAPPNITSPKKKK